MRKLLGGVCLSIWTSVSCGAGASPGADDLESTKQALPSAYPPVQTYSPGDPLPIAAHTHLVVSYCKRLEEIMAVGVDARTGTVAFRLQTSTSTNTSRFLTLAYSSGVPLTVYTAPVVVRSLEAAPPAPSGTPEVPDLPIMNPIHVTCSSDVGSDIPPGGGVPTGDQEFEERWDRFTILAEDTSDALHRVARPVPSAQ